MSVELLVKIVFMVYDVVFEVILVVIDGDMVIGFVMVIYGGVVILDVLYFLLDCIGMGFGCLFYDVVFDCLCVVGVIWVLLDVLFGNECVFCFYGCVG